MSINSFMILTYCLSDLINLIRFQFYYRPPHLMMARVIVLLACIFILSKSKLLLVAGRNFIKIQFSKGFQAFFVKFCKYAFWIGSWLQNVYLSITVYVVANASLFWSTCRPFQLAYKVDFWPLCTVSLWSTLYIN